MSDFNKILCFCYASNRFFRYNFNYFSSKWWVLFQDNKGTVKSFCMNVLPASEILHILANDKIDCNLKRPFLKYLTSIYLGSAMFDRKITRYLHKSWVYFTSFLDPSFTFPLITMLLDNLLKMHRTFSISGQGCHRCVYIWKVTSSVRDEI